MAGMTKEARAAKKAEKDAKNKAILARLMANEITIDEASALMSEVPVQEGIRIGKNGDKVSIHGLGDKNYPWSVPVAFIEKIVNENLWEQIVAKAKEIRAELNAPVVQPPVENSTEQTVEQVSPESNGEVEPQANADDDAEIEALLG